MEWRLPCVSWVNREVLHRPACEEIILRSIILKTDHHCVGYCDNIKQEYQTGTSSRSSRPCYAQCYLLFVHRTAAMMKEEMLGY